MLRAPSTLFAWIMFYACSNCFPALKNSSNSLKRCHRISNKTNPILHPPMRIRPRRKIPRHLGRCGGHRSTPSIRSPWIPSSIIQRSVHDKVDLSVPSGNLCAFSGAAGRLALGFLVGIGVECLLPTSRLPVEDAYSWKLAWHASKTTGCAPGKVWHVLGRADIGHGHLWNGGGQLPDECRDEKGSGFGLCDLMQ